MAQPIQMLTWPWHLESLTTARSTSDAFTVACGNRNGRDNYPQTIGVSPAATIAMISILAQERLLGFALGTVSMGAFVLHQRRAIYRSLADTDDAAGASFSYQTSEITGGRRSPDLAHVWNKAVDETLGQLVVYLSSRGW